MTLLLCPGVGMVTTENNSDRVRKISGNHTQLSVECLSCFLHNEMFVCSFRSPADFSLIFYKTDLCRKVKLLPQTHGAHSSAFGDSSRVRQVTLHKIWNCKERRKSRNPGGHAKQWHRCPSKREVSAARLTVTTPGTKQSRSDEQLSLLCTGVQ